MMSTAAELIPIPNPVGLDGGGSRVGLPFAVALHRAGLTVKPGAVLLDHVERLRDEVDPYWLEPGPRDPRSSPAFSGLHGKYLWPRLDNLPASVALEISYWLTRRARLGHPTDLGRFCGSLHVIRNAIARRHERGLETVSLLDLSVDDWRDEVLEEQRFPRFRRAKPTPVSQNWWFSRLHIISSMMFYVDVAYSPLDWWQRDLWDVDVDPRIPHDPMQIEQRRRFHFARIQPEWLRIATRHYLRVGLESEQFRWRTAGNKCAGLTLWGDFLVTKGVDSPQLGSSSEESWRIGSDFVRSLHARPGADSDGMKVSSIGRYVQDICFFYEFALENPSDMVRATGDARWKLLTYDHVAALKRVVPKRPQRRPDKAIQRGTLDRSTMQQILERAPVLALPREESLSVRMDRGEVTLMGYNRPDGYRLLMLLIKTGRRASELRCADFECIVPMRGLPRAEEPTSDLTPVAYLRYAQTKISGADDLCPIDAETVQIIKTQQEWAREMYRSTLSKDGTGDPKVLFPRNSKNGLGDQPIAYTTLSRLLQDFSVAAELKDAEHRPVSISRTHRFRHTLATDLAAAGVPVTVLQRFMGHASPEMSMHYVALHQAEQEKAFLRFKKIDTNGDEIPMDRRDMFDVLSLGHKTNRILPNGLCLLPPTRECDRGNACYSCGHFATDASHLAEHRELRDAMSAHLQRWLDLQGQRGRPVDPDNVYYKGRRQELAALDRIIGRLEADDSSSGLRGAGTEGRADAVVGPAPLPWPSRRLSVK